jgi:hypothetical protein
MISDFIEVATKLGEFSEQLKQANAEKRERMATYFKTIGECLGNIAQQLKKGEIPATRFGELQVYAEQLSVIITDYVGKEEADKLSDWLGKTTTIIRKQSPTIIQESQNKEGNEESIQLIEEASGRFNALAITVDYSLSKTRSWSSRILLIVSSVAIIPVALIIVWYLDKILSYQHIIVSTDKLSPSSLSSPCSSLSGIYRGKSAWGVLKINYLTSNTKGTNCYFYADDNDENPYFSHLTTGSLKFKIGDKLLWNITTKRSNKSDKCETEMYGTLASSIKSNIVTINFTATDGRCDLEANYSETVKLGKN